MAHLRLRRRLSAPGHDEAVRLSRRAPASTTNAALVVQRRAGNRAVTGLLRQRDEIRLRSESGTLDPELDLLRHAVGVQRADKRKAAEEKNNAPIQAAITTTQAVAKLLRRKLRVVTDRDERRTYLRRIASLEAFPTTHKLPLLALRAAVMRHPRFLGVALDRLRRAEEVEVLGVRGSWYRVRSPRNIEGWIHRNRLIPKVVILRSGKTGSSSTRDVSGYGGGRA